MMNKLPVNFEQKLRDAKGIKGGYPYSIKAEDLMKDLVFAALQVDEESSVGGVGLTVEQSVGDNGHLARKLKVTSASGTDSVAAHPWQVTVDGSIATIAPGSLLYWQSSGGTAPGTPYDLTPLNYAGGTVAVSAGTSTIKAIVDCDFGTSFATSTDGFSTVVTFSTSLSSLSVQVGGTPTGDQLSVPIATVTIAEDGSATVGQFLNHNPIISVQTASII